MVDGKKKLTSKQINDAMELRLIKEKMWSI
jgi:hypothetical protein